MAQPSSPKQAGKERQLKIKLEAQAKKAAEFKANLTAYMSNLTNNDATNKFAVLLAQNQILEKSIAKERTELEQSLKSLNVQEIKLLPPSIQKKNPILNIG